MDDDAAKRRILIVEDDVATARYLTVVLEDAGFEVEPAVMAVEALNKIDANPPDAIVSDVNMPGASGVTMVQHLRQRDDTKLIPVLIYTSMEPANLGEVILNAPLTRILTKPSRPADIVRTIEGLLRAT